MSIQVVGDNVNKRQYATSKAQLASQRHLLINVDLSNPHYAKNYTLAEGGLLLVRC